MDSSVIILDSDDEDVPVQEASKNEIVDQAKAVKRALSEEINGSDGPSSKIRRVQPTKIGEITRTPSKEEAQGETNAAVTNPDPPSQTDPDPVPSTSRNLEQAKNALTPQLTEFIQACRAAEKSEEMKSVIKKKLLKYYHSVHPDYVTSKNFLKTLKATTEDILREPTLVYSKLKTVIEELDVRRKAKQTVFTTDEPVEVKDTNDEVKNGHLKKLNRALVKLKQQILDLEEEEVDWDDDDNSSYLKKVRFEKRACEIYDKICEITGESKHAHRIVKKPISFKGTDFPEFNRQLQKMVNRNNQFPNYRDVLKALDFCNKKHKFGLSKDQQSRVAQDAFEKLGKVLQQRRKSDLYETTTFYVGKAKDPAKDDPELRVQLEKNKKNYAKYDLIINEYAKKEEKSLSDDGEEVSSTSKSEPPATAIEPNDETASPKNDLKTSPEEKCDENGAKNTTNLEDDDIVILS